MQSVTAGIRTAQTEVGNPTSILKFPEYVNSSTFVVYKSHNKVFNYLCVSTCYIKFYI